MATKAKRDWNTVNLDTMPAALKPLWNERRKHIDALKATTDKFEAALTAHLTKGKKIPAGMVPEYGYNWGKLAVAFVSPDEAKSEGGKAQFTL